MICSTCHQDKDLHEFHPDGRYKTGYGTTCETCYVAALPTALVCLQCGIEQPLENYARATTRRIGRQQPCDTCRYTAQKEKVLANPQSRPSRWRQSAWICKECGIEKPVEQFRTKHDSPCGHIQPCKECYNQKQRQTRTLEPQKNRDRNQAWYAKNSRGYLKRRKAKRLANPEKHLSVKRAWRAANPVKSRLESHRRRTRKRALPVQYTDANRQSMLQYWGYACAVCGREQGLFDHKLSDDHWIPLNSPDCPGTIPANMIPLCAGMDGCNNSKGDDDGRAWLIRRYGKHKATRILKAIEAYFEIVRQRAAQQEGSAAD